LLIFTMVDRSAVNAVHDPAWEHAVAGEAVTGASQAAVQRNLAWMEARGLIRNMTGQGRHRIRRVSA